MIVTSRIEASTLSSPFLPTSLLNVTTSTSSVSLTRSITQNFDGTATPTPALWTWRYPSYFGNQSCPTIGSSHPLSVAAHTITSTPHATPTTSINCGYFANNIMSTGTPTLGLLMSITGPSNVVYIGCLARSIPVSTNTFTSYATAASSLLTSPTSTPSSTASINFSSRSSKSARPGSIILSILTYIAAPYIVWSIRTIYTSYSQWTMRLRVDLARQRRGVYWQAFHILELHNLFG